MATRRKTSSRTKKNNKQPINAQWSILLFGIGILLLAITFIPGNTGWQWIRGNIIFGVFGIGTYLLAPLVLYIAVKIAMHKPILLTSIKSALLILFVCGTFFVFSPINLAGKNFIESIQYLHSASTGRWGQGPGVLSAVLGVPIVGLIGRPGANIVIVILCIVGIMFITSKTPADIYIAISSLYIKMKELFSKYNVDRQVKAQQNNELKLQKQQHEQSQLQKQQNEFENKQALKLANSSRGVIDKSAFAQAMAKRDAQVTVPVSTNNGIDVDLGPNNVTTTYTNGNADVNIGPGGTFGINSVPSKTAGANNNVYNDSQFGTIISRSNVYTSGSYGTQTSANASLQTAAQTATADTLQPNNTTHNGNADKPVQNNTHSTNTHSSDSGAIMDLLVKAPPDKAEHKPFSPNSIAAHGSDAYAFPPLSLFEAQKADDEGEIEKELKKTADLLVKTLSSFGVQTKVIAISRGPSVTRYELKPLSGVKISRITSLADDISLNLATSGVRIEAPVPGKAAVGIEIPNEKRSTVTFRSIIESSEFSTKTQPLTFAVGKDISGKAVVGNLAKMPHLLIAGTTGSGKSVCTNGIIMSLLYRCSPQTMRLILIDPKMVEFAQYNGIPHLIMPVVTDPRKAAGALGSAVAEMEKRYLQLAEHGATNIEDYNDMAKKDDTMQPMPYFVIVIDELADLMTVVGKDIEEYIRRITQKSRAAGMHIIVATQRPSVDVVTGLIKSNIPSRIGLSVMSQIDSRTILDTAGAEKLLGNGDMLYMPQGINKPVRVQGAFIKSSEIRGVIDYIKNTSQTDYDEEMIAEMEKCATAERVSIKDDDSTAQQEDAMFKPAVEAVLDANMASVSLLQRRCKLGYARAARLVDEMEAMGIVGPYEGSKPRQVLISRQQWIEMSMRNDDKT